MRVLDRSTLRKLKRWGIIGLGTTLKGLARCRQYISVVMKSQEIVKGKLSVDPNWVSFYDWNIIFHTGSLILVERNGTKSKRNVNKW